MMGFSPREVDKMTLWEYRAICDAYVAKNNPEAAETPTPPSDAEFLSICGNE